MRNDQDSAVTPTDNAQQRQLFSTAHSAALRAALLAAFDQSTFVRFWQFEFGAPLENVVAVPGQSFTAIVEASIAWGLRHQKLSPQALLVAALRHNPTNPELLELQSRWEDKEFTYLGACPYPGMRPFSEAQTAQFFGRSAEIKQLQILIRKLPVVALVGSSGSGKSSLVHAGLMPVLKKAGWEVRSLRPAGQPVDNLRAALAGCVTWDSAPKRLSSNGTLLLAIDQFEEIFAHGKDGARDFLASVAGLVDLPDLHILLAVRAGYYEDFINTPIWPHASPGMFTIGPLTPAGLEEAICLPAEAAGVMVEPTLVERLRNEAYGEPGALPFLQETLALLWEGLDDPLLRLEDYDQLTEGRDETVTGLQVAMAVHAESVYASFGSASIGESTAHDASSAAAVSLLKVQQAMVCRTFMRLVQFGEGRSDTRRQQTQAQLLAAGDDQDAATYVLTVLVEGRLLTVSGAGRRYDISHEKLISGWPRLQGWITELKEAEQARRRLEAKAAEHERLGRYSGLLDAKELGEAQEYAQSDAGRALGVDSDLKQLIEHSVEAINPGFNRRGVITLAGALASLALWLGVFYLAALGLNQQVQIALWIGVAAGLAVLTAAGISVRRQEHWPQHLTQRLGRSARGLIISGSIIAASLAGYMAAGIPLIQRIQYCQAPPRAYELPQQDTIHTALVTDGIDPYSASLIRDVLARQSRLKAWFADEYAASECRMFFDKIVRLQRAVASSGEAVILANIEGSAGQEQPRTLDDSCTQAGQLGYTIAKAIDPTIEMIVLPEIQQGLPRSCKSWTLNNQALAARVQGDLATAESLLLQAIGEEPDYATAYLNLGDVYEENGDTNRAILNWTRASVLAPRDPIVQHKVADFYHDLWLTSGVRSNFQLAERYYRTALAADSGFVDACSGLANLYILDRSNLDVARQLLDTGTKSLQQSTLYNDQQQAELQSLLSKNYGLLALAQGDYETGVQRLREALDLSDKYAVEILDRLAHVYDATGRPAEACDSYARLAKAIEQNGDAVPEGLSQRLAACQSR